MAKRTPLQFSQTKTVPITPNLPIAEQSSVSTDKDKTETAPTSKRTQQGLKFIGGYFASEAKKQFQILCIQEGVTEERLLAEAINDLFAKKGLSRLA